MRIQDHHFLVTGGSSGLGEAVCRQLVSDGGSVSIFDINTELGQALADRLGIAASFIQTDITSESSVSESIQEALERFGPIRGLVNCAGIPGAKRVIGRDGAHDLKSFSKIIQVNLIGTFNVIRLAAEAMHSNELTEDLERGVIVNTASVATYDGQIGQAAYAASKGGVASMTLPIARELANFGIRVMTIAPGLFKTPMMDVLPDDVQESLGQSVPFPKRLGLPQEYATLAKHIIENCMLNGEVIRLDGAIRLAPK